MAWSDLGAQFSLTLAFGVFLGLTLLPRAPLGVFFFRLMGTTALIPLVGAIVLRTAGGYPPTDPVILAAGTAALAFPLVQAPLRASRRAVALWWSLFWSGVAVALSVAKVPLVESLPAWALASASAMATGAVAGGVGLAMVVGHWYLTVPQLPVSWLAKLNRMTAWAMVASAVALAATCLFHAEDLASADVPLLGPWGLFYLGGRVSVGIALPLLFAWMTASSLAHQNTRSATGILYASTVLVLIGAAISVSLQDSYGIPL